MNVTSLFLSMKSSSLSLLSMMFLSVFLSSASVFVKLNGLQLTISSLFKIFICSFKRNAPSEHDFPFLKQ